jgi:hypothetical protein
MEDDGTVIAVSGQIFAFSVSDFCLACNGTLAPNGFSFLPENRVPDSQPLYFGVLLPYGMLVRCWTPAHTRALTHTHTALAASQYDWTTDATDKQLGALGPSLFAVLSRGGYFCARCAL